MSGRAAWMLAGVAGVLLWGASASAQCTKDTDCKGDRICEDGKCTSPQRSSAAAPPSAETPAPPPEGAAPAAPEGAAAAEGAAPASGEAAAGAPGTTPPPAAVSAPVGDSPMAREPTEPVRVVPEPPEMRRRSRPAMVGGIIMASVGPVALIAALVAKGAQESCDQRLTSDYPSHVLPPSERYRVKECDSYSVPMYTLGIAGAVITTVGIPLIVYGAKRVPADSSRARLQLLPWAGRESGGVRLRLDL